MNNKNRFYIGLGALVITAVFTGLAFLPKIGAYFLIASVLSALGALAFFAAQKKVEKFTLLTVATVVTYCILAFCLLLFIGGLIYSLS